MARWVHRHSRHFAIYLFSTREVGERIELPSPEIIDRRGPIIPVGQWVRSRHCWVILSGAFCLDRPDGCERIFHAVCGAFDRHVAGPVRMTALEPNSRFACLNPRDPSIWWKRELIRLPAEGNHLIADIEAEQSFFIAQGRVREEGGKTYEAEQVIEIASLSGGHNLIAEQPSVLVRLVKAGRYEYAPPHEGGQP